MRFQVEPCEYPREGDMRTITRFLFLPKHIGNEVRWLEVVKIKQVAECYQGCSIVFWDGAQWEDD